MTDQLDYDAYTVPEPPDTLTSSILATVGEARRLRPSVSHVGSRTRVVVVAGALVAAAAVVLLTWKLRGGRDDGASDPIGDRTQRVVATDHQDPPRDRPITDTGEQRSEPISPMLRRLRGDRARDTLLSAIGRAAHERQAAGGGHTGTAAGGSGQDFVLSKDDIQAAMGEVRPLIAECYELALDTNPALSGKLTVEFTIIGEPDIGTIVEQAELESDDGMTDDADFAECVRETILSLEMPAPPSGGGKVQVRYPFIFRSSGEPTHSMSPRSDLDAARDAAKSGDYATALRLCQSIVAVEPDNMGAVMVCAIAACNLSNASLAQRFVSLLQSDHHQMARQICLRKGLDVD